MNGDKANPSDVHIFNAATNTWSTQTVNTGKFDPSSFGAILDHDTNVFYALSKGELWFLDMSSLKAATSSALPWTDAETSPYGSDYQPTMALAQNHVHFIGTPGTPAGSAEIFVIHCEYSQQARVSMTCSRVSYSFVLPAPGSGVLWPSVPRYPWPNRVILPVGRRSAGVRVHPRRLLGRVRDQRREQHDHDPRRSPVQGHERALRRLHHRPRPA